MGNTCFDERANIDRDQQTIVNIKEDFAQCSVNNPEDHQTDYISKCESKSNLKSLSQSQSRKTISSQCYLSEHFKEGQLRWRYIKIKVSILKDQQSQMKVKYSPYGYKLDHGDAQMKDINDFLSNKWQKVEYLILVNCHIDNKIWQKLVQKNARAFPNLKTLQIHRNSITKISEKDLLKFPSLRSIHITSKNKSSQTNPLSKNSLKQIERFSSNHPNVEVVV